MTPLPQTRRMQAGFTKMIEGISEILVAARECEELLLDWSEQAGEVGEVTHNQPPVEPEESLPTTQELGDSAQQAKAEPAPEPAPEPQPESEPEPEPVLTLEDVRGVLAPLSTAGKRDDIVRILGDHGAPKLTELDPSKYASVIEAAKKVA